MHVCIAESSSMVNRIRPKPELKLGDSPRQQDAREEKKNL